MLLGRWTGAQRTVLAGLSPYAPQGRAPSTAIDRQRAENGAGLFKQ